MLDYKLQGGYRETYYDRYDERICFYDCFDHSTTLTFVVVDEEHEVGPDEYIWLEWQVEMQACDVQEKHLLSREITYNDFLKYYSKWYTLEPKWDLYYER